MFERAGQQIGGYRLLQLLGQGGFSEVYLGEHISQSTHAAIKIMDTALTEEEVEKFLMQEERIARLRHPHIVRIHHYGIEAGLPFIVMDYAPHGTMRQRHPRGTQLPLPTVVSYVKQVADALQYIHNQNLVHRDIKPHNMLLGPDYQILLSDFGLALIAQSMGYRRQRPQEFEGTILYAAPEQVRGRPRIASDQYALGIVVYEWLSGTWPFYGTLDEVAHHHTLTPPPSLTARVPNLSPAVEQVVFRALEKDPHQRFESVNEFAKALERASRIGSSIALPQVPRTDFHPPLPFSLPMKKPVQETSPVSSARNLLTYTVHTDGIYAVTWSPQGQQIASSSMDETVQIWEATTGKQLYTYRSHSLQAQAITWSPDGMFIASTGGLLSEQIHIWDADTGKDAPFEHTVHTGHSETIHAIAWSPQGAYLASGGEDMTVQVWNTSARYNTYTYKGHSATIKTLAWSPDGVQIASAGDDKTVHVWDATTGSHIHIYYSHNDVVNAVAWSPDGTQIASASNDQTVHIWEAATARKIRIYTGHKGGVMSLAWSPDGKYIASGGLDETVQVWESTTGKCIFTYTGHSDWVSSISWSPDGMYIASGSWDKTVHIWKAPQP